MGVDKCTNVWYTTNHGWANSGKHQPIQGPLSKDEKMKTFKVLFYETHMAEKFIDAKSVEEVKELLGVNDENDVITDQDTWPHSSLLVEHGWVQDQIINIKDQED